MKFSINSPVAVLMLVLSDSKCQRHLRGSESKERYFVKLRLNEWTLNCNIVHVLRGYGM